MWAYVYFIMHLDDIQASDYTALELYVARLVSTFWSYSLVFVFLDFVVLTCLTFIAQSVCMTCVNEIVRT